MDEKHTETTNYTLGCHLVVFLDVLGQREKFRALRLPKSPEEYASVAEVLRQTAGFVVGLRETFQRQFAEFDRGLTNFHQRTEEPIRPNFVGFSDLFVTSVPLWNRNGDHLATTVTISSALSAASVVMLTSLANRHALRGGIEVGFATEIAQGETYGTALERAYILESSQAQYPRIVIGDDLWKYVNTAIAHFKNQKTPESSAIATIFERTMRMISADKDGKRILDYLGEVMVEIAGPEKAKTAMNMIRPAYEFILTEHERVLTEGNAKLAGRYALLRQYFESRLALWGLDKR
ncbi:MAG TPA: hypothetical protein VKB26_03290 [Candidatus Acidoferrales bacterium]|nr:hypothetical protein [Candidatus Acidoferrales bacterium]